MMQNDSIDTISLHTNTGSTGYRIIKFDIFPVDPFKDDYESMVQIFKIPQTFITYFVGSSNAQF